MADVRILGVPMDLGAGRRGVDMGPSALRLARLAGTLTELGHKVLDLGNVEVPIPETLADSPERSRWESVADAIAQTCAATIARLDDLQSGDLFVALGGDHSLSMGTVAAAQRASRLNASHFTASRLKASLEDGASERVGVLWIDAHADLNTPTSSPSGNVHGMPVAHLLGLGDPRFAAAWGGGPVIAPSEIVYIGLRSLDPPERALIRDLGITAFSMKEVDGLGIATVATAALEQLTGAGKLHVSFDADVLDPAFAPGVGTPVRGGLTYREAHLLMELLADSGLVASVDLLEVNPILDSGNRTATVLVELAASLLGRTIL